MPVPRRIAKSPKGAPKQKHHLLFVDDDSEEVQTFVRLYEGERFEVTPIHAQFPRAAVLAIEKKLKRRRPDLFVLDLFFPEVKDPPRGLSEEAIPEIRVRLNSIVSTAHELPELYLDGQKLLRGGAELVYRSQTLLRDWCKALRQSPMGGILLMGELKVKYPKIPTVFYSRKATVKDVKIALDAGALDVLLKPHVADEQAEAERIGDAFSQYCQRNAPGFLIGWRKRVSKDIDWGNR
jgi:CheY-like chemotaxis protein